MSNPYGGNPYGGQGGQNPYGAPYQGPGGGLPAKTDGVSIAAFVLSLVCCGPIALILGIVGLTRTKNGQRKGRWAAIAGVIIGALATVSLVVGTILTINFASSFITPDKAEVGQCANITTDADTVILREKDCTDEHDGEIVYVGEVEEIETAASEIAISMPDEVENITTDEEALTAICKHLIGEDATKVGEDLTWGLALEDPNDPADSDPFICYVESDDKLDEAIL